MAGPSFTIYRREDEAVTRGPLIPMLNDDEDITVGGKLNEGMATVRVRVAADPSGTMWLGDVVEIARGDGTVLGRWKYERDDAATDIDDSWTVELLPFSAELAEVDFAGNYSEPAPAGQTSTSTLPPLNPQAFDRPVNDAVLRTKHCRVRGATHNDGKLYSQLFERRSRVIDPLRSAVNLGGPGWWWFCWGDGSTELEGTPRATQTITWDMVIWRHPANSLDNVRNVQPLDGGQYVDENGMLAPRQSQREIAGGVYGTAQLGRRVAQTVQDATLSVQAELDSLGDAILARAQIPLFSETLRLAPGAPRCTSGDQVTLLGPTGAVLWTHWVTQHSEELLSGCQNLVVASEFGAWTGNPNASAANFLSSTGGGGGSGSGGSGGGGYALLAEAHGAYDEVVAMGGGTAALSFTLDSGGIPLRITTQGSIRISALSANTTFATLGHIGLPAGMQDAQQKRIPLGVWTPFTHTAVSRTAAAPDGEYSVGLAIGAAASWELVWDMYADVYAVGVTAIVPVVTSVGSVEVGGVDADVLISGTGLTGALAVMFGDVPATSFFTNADVQIFCRAPSHEPGTVHVTVVTPAGTSALSIDDQFTFT